jgi:aldehyde:ferredoxin oxidoreductase
MSVKSQEFPAYDSRGIQGMGLAYATSNRGACHLRGYTVASEVLGIPVKTDPLVTEGKADLVKAFQDATASSTRPASACSPPSPGRWPTCSRRFEAACEGDWSMESWPPGRRAHLEHGAPVQQRRRLHRQGRRPAAAPEDRTGQDRPGQGLVSGIDKMRPEYYKVRGWTPEGVPTRHPGAAGPVISGIHGGSAGSPALLRQSPPAHLPPEGARRRGRRMKHVIIGNGPAGVVAAETLRRLQPATPRSP